MKRRYEDAIKVFVDALIYIQRTRTMLQSPTKSLLNDMVSLILAECLNPERSTNRHALVPAL